ncbi:ABC transporter permease [Bacillaceae bacterium W0354]
MFTFMKKDFLIMIRDRQELKILLVMPIVLTMILGFALKGVMSGETDSFHMNVAVVIEDNDQLGIQAFLEELESQPIPEVVQEELTEVVNTVQPIEIIKDFLNHEDVKSMIEAEYMDIEGALEALKNEEIVAILTLPEDFTYSFYQHMIFDEQSSSVVEITTGKHSSMLSSIFEETIDSFIHNINFETVVNKIAGENAVSASLVGFEGEVVTVTNEKPISSTKYYTIAMFVMYALFVASTITSKSFVESYYKVFNRILLSGKSAFLYLFGKGLTTVILVILQALILFVFSSIIFQSFNLFDPTFWVGFFFSVVVFAFCVGSIAMVLVALTLRKGNNTIANFFSAGLISILALLGGSFVPAAMLPDIVGKLGEWTPNGISLNLFLQWSQGLGMEYALPLVGKLLVLTLIFVIASYIIFPKREVKS